MKQYLDDPEIFTHSSKRRRGFNSEAHVNAAFRTVRGGAKELIEKLERNDLCPCGSGRKFQELLPEVGQIRWLAT